MGSYIKAIWLLLTHGYEGAVSLLSKQKSEVFKKQIDLERKLFEVKSKLEKETEQFKTRLKDTIRQSEKNEAIREKHFGPNPERTREIKQRNKEKWDKYFGENGKFK